MKIDVYDVISAEGDSLLEVKNKIKSLVNEKILKGWKPLGGISISSCIVGDSTWYTASQAMIKE